MNIITIKTNKVADSNDSLLAFLDRHIKTINEGSVLAITSKIVAILEGRTVQKGSITKEELVAREADLRIPQSESKYGIILTIKDDILIPTAGIDESNAEGLYVLWPEDSQKTASQVWAHFRAKFGLKDFGVIITDSKTTPLRRGTTGIALAHCGFLALKNYVGKSDIFGQPLRVTNANVMDGLASAAVLTMGEGSEQTPLALISNAKFVTFTNTVPTDEHLKHLRIPIEEDLYAPILKSISWEKRVSSND